MAKKKKESGCKPGCECNGGCSGGEQNVYHGLYVSYDPDTKLYVEANYDMGVLHGEYTEFYDMDSGLIKSKGYYNAGLKEGQWISYNSDGAVKKVETFKKGKAAGKKR
jgi:antitoxin component YwqK of YwqJK toxin-antitoxin module